MIYPRNFMKLVVALAVTAGGFSLAGGIAPGLKAHPGKHQHTKILTKPIAGVRNNYWYDYLSDVQEAENELRKDLDDAKDAKDRRQAWKEYNHELADARKDYRKEMIEKGYIRKGRVTVFD